MTRREAGTDFARPQGAFVAGGARRRRLSRSRPKAAWWQRVEALVAVFLTDTRLPLP